MSVIFLVQMLLDMYLIHLAEQLTHNMYADIQQ